MKTETGKYTEGKERNSDFEGKLAVCGGGTLGAQLAPIHSLLSRAPPEGITKATVATRANIRTATNYPHLLKEDRRMGS